MNCIICEPYRQICLYMCVMVDQREALAVTTRLTDRVRKRVQPSLDPNYRKSNLPHLCAISVQIKSQFVTNLRRITC
jgi:hypothetical protein